MFITFEGIDGSGKTTAANALRNYLASIGYNVEITCDPGGTLAGEEIRAILRSPHWQLGSVTRLLLSLASHAELLRTISSLLEKKADPKGTPLHPFSLSVITS